MQRLPISGASLASGELTPGDLRTALERLEVSHAFDDAALDDFYRRLARISGNWFANEESKRGSPVRSALRKVGKDLAAATQLLSGHETGVHSTTEIFAAALTKQMLALDPTLKIDANQYLLNFLEYAAGVGRAAQIAAADLDRKSDIRGKEKLDWYDDFTRLLITIAERAKVQPTLGYDPIGETPCGWLVEAAQEFEAFLSEGMRSPTVRACGGRLVRSQKRLKALQAQKPARAK